MRVFFIFFSLFILNTYLNAYSTRIVIGTFTSESNAKRLVKKLPTLISNYNELEQLLKKDNITVHIRKVNGYKLVVAEVFSNEQRAKKALKIIKKRLTYAYLNDVPLEQYEAQKEIEKREIDKKKKLSEVKTELKKETTWRDALKFVDFTFLVVFIIFMSIIYLFFSYKEKFDQY